MVRKLFKSRCMKRKLSLLVTVGFTIASSGAAEFKVGQQTFTLPEGFTLERVAGPGLVDRPVEMDFDEQGRLYVTDSSGSNEPVKKQLEQKPHRIVRLEDVDGDGVFDKSIVFADKMMFPEGAMWLEGSLYVSAPPAIWKLTDTDGDGVADRREEWLNAKTLTGCANDLHGPYLGLDGWIYWCKGAFDKQTYERPTGKPFETRAAHIFRRRPEGGVVEPVMTGGMDNPVEVAFTPEGERIFTTTFFQQPGGGQRDGLVHAIYGGVYGKVNDVTDDHKKTGELMPVLTQLGPAAPCGLVRYESQVFGKEYQDNLFACLFNLHKVTRHILRPAGGTFQTVDSDFLTCDSTDFHPTDVLEDADGSLLVIDTGGWYKICCPTSQLWKPDVLGAIYRIRKTDAPRVNDPRGTKLDWKSPKAEELVDRLKDVRPAVAKRAISALRKRTDAASALQNVITGGAPTAQKRNAVWALSGNVDAKAPDGLRAALKSLDGSVQHAAVHVVSVNRVEGAAPDLLPLLKSSDAQVRRVTAEALGRIGGVAAVKPLLEAAAGLAKDAGSQPAIEGGTLSTFTTSNRILEHSVIYALIELDQPKETRAGLHGGNAYEKRAAMIALDQMENSDLVAREVVEALDRSTPAPVMHAANWIIGHRREWATAVASYLRGHVLAFPDLSSVQRADLEQQLQNLGSAPAIQEMLATVAEESSAPRAARLFALDALKRCRLKEVPEPNFLVHLVQSGDSDVVQHAAAVAGAGSWKVDRAGELNRELAKAAEDDQLSTRARLEALNALPAGAALNSHLFNLLCTNLAPELGLDLRTAASTVLAKAKLSDEQLLELGSNVRASGPLEIARLVDLYLKSSNDRVGHALIGSLRVAQALSALHSDRLKQVLAKYSPALRAEAKDLLEKLDQDGAGQAAYLDDLLPKLQDGDVRRGQAIFNSTRASCSSCHAIGYLGGNLGPDLTRVGQIRTERDLLESIVYPSASFVRSYEPYIVTSKAGDDFSGVLRKDNAEEVVLGTGPGAEVRMARSEIANVRPGQVSIMPQGLNEQLTRQELADILAFLKATRW